jgi:plasmid stabilization system protein ParE
MKYPLIFSALASEDLTDIIGWYKNQTTAGLGKQFIESMSVTLKRIETSPNAFPIIHQNIRRALIKRFPYKVLFYLDLATNEVHIIAVVHQSRDPKIWEKRI